jgi:aryl-alcohol dehydrogenase-like predicted oxidoreductase
MRASFAEDEVRCGLGLIGIGKPWGVVPGEVPSDLEARRFLEGAYAAGVRYFDTAASYGCSERRLGEFLRALSPTERSGVTVATKFGEHWDEQAGQPYVDHSFAALAKSLERSLERLGAIDVLQLHKSSPEVLASDDLARAWEMAATAGIRDLGPSVSDLESARLASACGRYQMLQLPLNSQSPQFAGPLEAAGRAGMWAAINRPFAMGQIVVEAGAQHAHAARVEAFEDVLSHRFRGVILSGTKSLAHLRENLEAFREANERRPQETDPHS